jgi:hypothetical protein
MNKYLLQELCNRDFNLSEKKRWIKKQIRMLTQNSFCVVAEGE